MAVNGGLGGYLSEKDKRRYTLLAGSLGGVCFVLQMAAPLVFILAMMFSMSRMEMPTRQPKVASGTLWQGAFWYPEVGAKGEGGPQSFLMAVTPASAAPEEKARVPLEDPQLLPQGDCLWVVGSAGVGFFEKGVYHPYAATTLEGDWCRPFLFDAKPAVVQGSPNGFTLLLLGEKGWEKRQDLPWLAKGRGACLSNDLKVLPGDGTYHVFWFYSHVLYYHAGWPQNGDEGWSRVTAADCDCDWSPFLLAGEPAVLYGRESGKQRQCEVLLLKGGEWKSYYQGPASFGYGWIPVGTGPDFKWAVVSTRFGRSLTMAQFDGAAPTTEKKWGKDSPFSEMPFPVYLFSIPYGLSFAMPFLLAALLSFLMRRHRVCDYEAGGRKVPYASLTRRAVAQLVDALILLLPLALVVPLLFGTNWFVEGATGDDPTRMMARVFGLWFACLLWMGLCLVGFAVWEGRRGLTPGKWAAGIVVLGTDLEYCGIGRAFLRNVLKMADGMFNFFIGIMMAALTEHWQRIGDLAARTIVVRRGGDPSD